MERVVGNRSLSTPYMASSNSAGSCVALCLIETPIGQESSKMLLINHSGWERPKDMDTPRTLYNNLLLPLVPKSLLKPQPLLPRPHLFSNRYLNLLISTEVLTKHLAPSTAHTQATR
ncbi:unnamed protein product [Arabidopsis thaliana]|uniref:Uncharacterized protein n=1 Tax=Arabidopsis thaliana TaxID=3702 RepID=A0A5S9XHB1_ARATH|nr:unnamed protein product [Arabidopsis thaliana]